MMRDETSMVTFGLGLEDNVGEENVVLPCLGGICRLLMERM